MDAETVVGNTALVVTIVSHFCSLPMVLEFFKKRSTGSTSVVPFFATASCVSLWLQYSLLLRNSTLQTVNLIGVTLQVSYIFCFYLNTIDKAKVLRLSLLVILLQASAYSYGFIFCDVEKGKNFLGLSASSGSIISCGAPLVSLGDVIRTQNSRTLPFPVIFSSFLVSFLWFIYGILVQDSYIQVPNFIGTILCIIQLILIVVYPAKVEKDVSKKE